MLILLIQLSACHNLNLSYPYSLACHYNPFSALQSILVGAPFRFIKLECPSPSHIGFYPFRFSSTTFYVIFSVIWVPGSRSEWYSSISPTQFLYSSIWYISYSAFHYLFTFLCPLLKLNSLRTMIHYCDISFLHQLQCFLNVTVPYYSNVLSE